MSATGRSDVRVPLDDYPTPPFTVRRLLEGVKLPGGRWLEPTAGAGSIIRAVNEVRSDVVWTACDLQQKYAGAGGPLRELARDALCCDFRMVDIVIPDVTVVIGNPPYALADRIIEHCFAVAPNALVVMLLRLNYLGADERGDWMAQHPPDVYVIPNRPSFKKTERIVDGKVRKSSSDSCEYGWFLWPAGNAPRRRGLLRHLARTPKAERCAPRAGRSAG